VPLPLAATAAAAPVQRLAATDQAAASEAPAAVDGSGGGAAAAGASAAADAEVTADADATTGAAGGGGSEFEGATAPAAGPSVPIGVIASGDIALGLGSHLGSALRALVEHCWPVVSQALRIGGKRDGQ
jgi:hypothetical protein